MDDQQINTASAGGDQFFVTTGLLQKACDNRLRAVLAHELGDCLPRAWPERERPTCS